MTNRSSTAYIVSALAVSLSLAPALSPAQTNAPADASSTNAAPATPAPAEPATMTTAPAAAPADTNAPASMAPEERPTTYTIAKGDSLWSIAHKYGTTVVKLRKLNNLKKHALLHPGQVLQLPPATDDSTSK